MADVNYKDAIPTLKDKIDHATVDSVLALDVDNYKYGFSTELESDRAPMGLSEDTIRFISKKKAEPEWMLEWRLDAYRRWRASDQQKLAGFTHALVQGFGTGVPGLGDMRGLSLMAFDLVPGAKSLLARHTMGLAGRVPRLARHLGLTR